MNMMGMTHFMITCCWAAGPDMDMGEPIFVCQIMAAPMRSGSKLNASPRKGMVKGRVNRTSGPARLSIQPKKGA